MAQVAPFRGVRYTPQAGPLERLVAPPYDVISPAEQQRLLDQSPHNVVRLILSPEQPDDDEAGNRYTRAAARLQSWLDDGVLAFDRAPAVYVYDREFELNGRRLRRRGFLSAVTLEELGKGSIYPHEGTLAGPKADRLKLMTACDACLSPIFSIYPDEDGALGSELDEAMAQAGVASVSSVDAADGRHTLTPIAAAQAIARIQELMAPKPIYIADGHHRYETSWAYRGRRIQTHGAAGAADCVMMLNVAMSDPGLAILPTHRVIRNVEGWHIARFKAACEPLFHVEQIPCPVGKLDIGRHQFVVYFGCSHGCVSLRLKDEDLANCVPSMSRTWNSLDVSILRNLIFGQVLGLDPDSFAQGSDIAYVHQSDEAMVLVDDKGWDAAFLLDPTHIDEVESIEHAGERMPPKSTYFYPKLLSGLVLYLFHVHA